MGRLSVVLVLVALSAGVQAIGQTAPMTQAQIDEFRKGAFAMDTKGLTLPAVVKEAKPVYTREAMQEKLQGMVELEIVVGVDGTVSRVRVTKSLDKTYGLDEAAMDAAKKWLFKPGTLAGRTVPVIVVLSLDFRLH